MSTIDVKYNELGGRNSYLGAPETDERVCPDGVGHYRHYQYGSIYWHPSTGAFEVHGNIRAKWSNLGWEKSVLGYPVTDERVTPDKVGRYNHFQRGSIYWHPDTGAFEVHGNIRAKWSNLGWEKSVLGYPLTDELTTPDKKGRYNHFQYGSIYWHPDTGAFEVHGAIRSLWSTLGWERSYLGYPITDELATPGPLRCQRFQKGSILWTPDRGAREVPGTSTRYLIGIDKFRIAVTRAVHEDTDHVKLAVKIGDQMMLELPVKHMGDVNNGEHMVGLYFEPPCEVLKPDTIVTFNYVIDNIGGADYSAIENGLKKAAAAGLTALGVPGGDAIAEIASTVYHLFAADCDGPVAVDQVSATGHLLDKWTAASRVYSETRHYTYESQLGCGDSPQYYVTWSIVRL